MGYKMSERENKVSVTQRDGVFPNIPDPVEKAERVVGAAYDLAHLTGLGLTSKAKVDAKSVKADKGTFKKLTITGQNANEPTVIQNMRVNGELVIGANTTTLREAVAGAFDVLTAGAGATQNYTAAGSHNFNGTTAAANNATVNVNGALNVSRDSNLSALNVSGAIAQSGAGQVSFTGNVDASLGVDVSGGALTVTNQAITQTNGGQVTFAGNVDASSGLDVTGADLTVAANSSVGGNLGVTGAIASGALGSLFETITADAAFTAEVNKTYLITATLTATRIITLPSPVTTAGTTIRFVLGADNANTRNWTIGQGTALGAVAFAAGSALISSAATTLTVGNVAAAANNTVTIAGATNGGGGVGSTVVLTSTGTAWYVHGFLVPQGTGAEADASAFSTVA